MTILNRPRRSRGRFAPLIRRLPLVAQGCRYFSFPSEPPSLVPKSPLNVLPCIELRRVRPVGVETVIRYCMVGQSVAGTKQVKGGPKGIRKISLFLLVSLSEPIYVSYRAISPIPFYGPQSGPKKVCREAAQFLRAKGAQASGEAKMAV